MYGWYKFDIDSKVIYWWKEKFQSVVIKKKTWIKTERKRKSLTHNTPYAKLVQNRSDIKVKERNPLEGASKSILSTLG